MTWDDFRQIWIFVFAFTGALCWLCAIFLIWFYWMCRRPPEKE